jgi:hypothetical protein
MKGSCRPRNRVVDGSQLEEDGDQLNVTHIGVGTLSLVAIEKGTG